jgi:hypothetical protein
MNVWILVISALFTPVSEPLGFSMADAAPPAMVELEPAPSSMAAPITSEPRFHGLERMLAELEAHAR